MRHSRRIPALALLLFLAGCAAVTLVDPAKRAAVGDGVSVLPQTQWNQLKDRNEIVWTQNGFSLDTVRFVTGIKSGAPLYPISGLRKDMMAPYDSKMLPNDIEDLVVSTTEKEGFENVRAANLAPCPFGDGKGFCFDLDFATKDGLSMKGKVMAAKEADRLELMEFRAPAEYYYDSIVPQVDKLFASAEAK